MLVKTLELEVAQHVDAHKAERHRLVVRNGKSKPRKVTCGAGTIEVEAPV